jgi:hypothetical protein
VSVQQLPAQIIFEIIHQSSYLKHPTTKQG